MKIELVGLSEDNMKQCFDLKVASEQMQYIVIAGAVCPRIAGDFCPGLAGNPAGSMECCKSAEQNQQNSL